MRGNKKVTTAKGKNWPLIFLAVARGSWLHAAKQRYLSGMLDLNLRNLTTCHLTCAVSVIFHRAVLLAEEVSIYSRDCYPSCHVGDYSKQVLKNIIQGPSHWFYFLWL